MACDITPDLSAFPTGTVGPQGVAGATGAAGANGIDGADAYTTLSASFTQPAVSSTVLVTVAATAWMATGLIIFVTAGGYYRVVSRNSSTTATIRNLGLTVNTPVGGTVYSGGLVTPAGEAGESGTGDATEGEMTVTAASLSLTLDHEVHHFVNAIVGGITVTLPAASTNSGVEFFIKNISVSSITVDATSTGLIYVLSTTATLTLNVGESLHVVSNGTNWVAY